MINSNRIIPNRTAMLNTDNVWIFRSIGSKIWTNEFLWNLNFCVCMCVCVRASEQTSKRTNVYVSDVNKFVKQHQQQQHQKHQQQQLKEKKTFFHRSKPYVLCWVSKWPKKSSTICSVSSEIGGKKLYFTLTHIHAHCPLPFSVLLKPFHLPSTSLFWQSIELIWNFPIRFQIARKIGNWQSNEFQRRLQIWWTAYT